MTESVTTQERPDVGAAETPGSAAAWTVEPRDRPLLSSGTFDRQSGALRTWRGNAEIIAEVLEMFHPPGTPGLVADVTYGRGVWWRECREPDVRHGLDVAGSGDEFNDGVDFRHLPEADGTFAVVAFDPPYTATGSPSKHASVGDMRHRFGIALPTTPAGIQHELINPGLTEVHRVLAPGGLALVKVKNYISGGRLWAGEFYTLAHAVTLDMDLVAHYVYVGRPGPQPSKRGKAETAHRAQHPRSNTSSLFVLRRMAPLETQEALL